MKKAIVLGADNHYMDKVETTIKSICSKNKEVKFYVFNSDLPIEWFQLMDKRLSVLGSEIVNVKVTESLINQFHLPTPHLSSATYLRYFIPTIVFEKRVLYLDSDIIVTADLTSLFEFPLDGCPLAAVPDILNTSEGFNSGVLLIDTDRWREDDIQNQLLNLTIKHHEHVYGDQEILNMLFKDRWKKLSLSYNLQVGYDTYRHSLGDNEWYHLFEGIPNIIHYTTQNKPWSHYRFNRFRDIWWFYYGLNWNDILLDNQILQENFEKLIKPITCHASIFTNTGDIEGLPYLLEQLPNVQFHIAAPTYFSPNIVELQRYSNLYIYPCVDPKMKETLINQTNFYLDINYGPALDDALQEIVRQGNPIYSFESTSHFSNGENQVFAVDNVDEMVKSIQNKLSESHR
ncbi:TPA: glycosyltransferase family 8 protein [Streptococcus pneumoniae]|nr:glycosyltransferase family 8 protein [Streptococcus pneumoniae]